MRSSIATAVIISTLSSTTAQAASWSGECVPSIEPQLEALSAVLASVAPEGACESAEGLPFVLDPRVSITEISVPAFVGPREIGEPSGVQKTVVASWVPVVTSDEDIAPRPIFIIHKFEPYRRANQVHKQASALIHERVSAPAGEHWGSLTFVGPKWQSWRAKSMTGLLDMGAEAIHVTALILATGGVGIAYQNLKNAEDYWGTPLDVGHGTSELVDGVHTGDFDRGLDGYAEACSGVLLATSVALPLSKGAGVLPKTAAIAAPSSARSPGPIPVATPGARYVPTRFAKGKFEQHFAKHSKEFGAITQKQYLDGARSLLSRDIGGEIEGAVRSNGDVLRYNRLTNEFAVGQADGTIRTYFRPEDGIVYWQAQVGP